MAIGLGQMFGFTIPENFKHPYESMSITEYWHRWHITLGTWFREYLYIPLGGNRKGIRRQIINLFVVWFLTGLWHGAGWNFILWGIYYFILLMIEKIFLYKRMQEWHSSLKHIYTILFVVIGWIIFACTDIHIIGRFLKAMIGMGSSFAGGMTAYYITSYAFIFVIVALLSTSLPIKIAGRFADNKKLSERTRIIIKNCFCFFLLIISVSFLVGDSYNPFLYFRF